jgi:hypothetical protein
LYQVLLTFTKFAIAMIFFRADSVVQIFEFITNIFSFSLFEIPELSNYTLASEVIALIFVFMLIEWQGREQLYAIEKLGFKWKKPFRYLSYYIIVFLILFYAGQEEEFIYFQF